MTQHSEFEATEFLSDGRAPTADRAQTLDIRFTGSGSEYFRIWIVNLLLTLITFTLYWPFARARRLAYFQNNTLVGRDPLGFHGDPWKMFRGYLLMVMFGVSYWAVSNLAPALAWVPLLLLAVLWPALWRASLQFRLRNTSWRGVRMSFEGDLKGAYLCMLPFFIPVVLIGMVFGVVASAMQGAEAGAAGAVFAAVTGVVVLAMTALSPWLLARIKRYQHGGYAFAQERTRLDAGLGAFYGFSFRAMGVSFLCTALLAGLGAIVAAAAGGFSGAAVIMLPFLLALAYLVFPLLLVPYTTSRLQNLLWANTRSRRIRFDSQLQFAPLVALTAKNWLFIALTLGLYWPFAKVHTARMRLEAMGVSVQGDVNAWLAKAQGGDKGILGDAAGDFFGIDMGL
ncbi:YjgN family protein [Hydrogenophaga sp.]|uniref:YjgN family protein n=1 Tax=Hydrogenophaga sp. TaxID=1904254 RepID=UPI003AF620AF